MVREIETRNAIIQSARLTNDDHGLLSAWLDLDYGGAGQGFGGYSLYLPADFTHSTNQKNYAGHWIWRCMEVADVSEWSNLAGRTVRVRCEHSKVHAIGHIVKDIWFDPSAEFNAMEAACVVNAHDELVAALKGILDRYVGVIISGDCGFWNPEEEPEVIAARAALSKAEA